MMKTTRLITLPAASLFVTLVLASAQTKEPTIPMHHARGTFDVKLAPLKLEDASDPMLARMSINKQLHGDLEGTSVGEMLSAATNTKGSAGYVAMEKVTGTLNGRGGSFVLQHNATMDRGKPSLKITVVPDSGTRELEGLTGTMNIIIEQGKHSYEFEYTLPVLAR